MYFLIQTPTDSIKAACEECWEEFIGEFDWILLEEEDPAIFQKVVRVLRMAGIQWHPAKTQCPHIWVALDPEEIIQD